VILANSVQRSRQHGVPVLIYGAGRRGAAAALELFQNQGLNLRPVGFIDDDWQMRGMIVAGLPVLGTGRDMANALRDTTASGVVISSHRITKERLERAAEACRERHGNLFHLHLGIRRAEQQDEEDAGEVIPAAGKLPDPSQVPGAASFVGLTEAAWHDSQPCPSCKGWHVHRSKARNLYERFRKSRTDRRLYRCEECGWRGWLIPLEFAARTRIDVPSRPDFGSLTLP
jgi:predicted RNA-binding Zn-ribbon protein involved in translation (DUF1610 family)